MHFIAISYYFMQRKNIKKKSYTLLLLIKSFDLLTNKNNENLKVVVLFPLLRKTRKHPLGCFSFLKPLRKATLLRNKN